MNHPPAPSVTSDKVAWIEEQASRLLAFSFESRAQLSQNAQTTLQWLFGVMAGSAGYLVNLWAGDTAPPRAILIVLAVLALVSAGAAARLICGALLTDSLLPPGNIPRNLMDPEFIAQDLNDMRAGETSNLQARIEESLAHNRKMGGAINEARWVLAALPLIPVVGWIATRVADRS